MKAKEIGIWFGVIAVLIAGLWVLISAVNNSPSPSAPAAIKIPDVSAQDFIRGLKSASESAKVILVEYADFQCPACGTYYPLVKQLETEFKNDLRIVYRFFPLTNIHQNAMLSAQAAFAAGLQGKFWEMHDLIYENQDRWSNTQARDIFVDYASKLGIESSKFASDMDNESTKKFITDETNKAIALGINSTPTFFVNRMHIQNPSSYENFKKIIQDEINKK